MTCGNVREALSAYVDGALPEAERASTAVHIEACPECRCEFEALQATVNRLRAQPLPEAPDLVAGVRRKLEPAHPRMMFAWPSWHALALAGSAAAVALLVISPAFKVRQRDDGRMQLAQYATQASQTHLMRAAPVREGRVAYETDALKADAATRDQLAKELGFSTAESTGSEALGTRFAAARAQPSVHTAVSMDSRVVRAKPEALTAAPAVAGGLVMAQAAAPTEPENAVAAAPKVSVAVARPIQTLIQLQRPSADPSAAAAELIGWVEARGGFAVQTTERHLAIKLPPAAVTEFATQFPDAHPADPAAALLSTVTADASQALWVSLSLELTVPQ